MMLSSTRIVTVGVVQHYRRTGCVYRKSFIAVGSSFLQIKFRYFKGPIHPKGLHVL